jgi:uncharacterized protein (DUF2461 family)
MTKSNAYFSPALFKFLRELKKNNNREWFQLNKARCESEVRNPMLRVPKVDVKVTHDKSPYFNPN